MNENTSTWAGRINAAAEVLHVAPEILTDKLRTMGILPDTGLAMLDDEEVFKFGDLRAAWPEMPIAPLRMAMKFLRPAKPEQCDTAPKDERTQQLQALGLKVKLDDADSAVLLNLYLPDKSNDPVTNALRKRFGSKPVVAYKDDGSVAVPETMAYVAGLEQGYPPAESIMVNGKLAKLWPVGVKPLVMVEEDPLFQNYPLRNGISTVNFRNWSKISLRCRQLCRVILMRGDINPDNKEATLRLLERAVDYNALVDAYPEADLALRELEARNEAPKLMIPLGESPKQQFPFGVPRRY
jgi:hypothetical protein